MFLPIASTSAARIAAVTSCVVTAVACETFRILRRRQKRRRRRKQKEERRQVSDFFLKMNPKIVTDDDVAACK